MDLHVESSKQSRLTLIDFIDKLNMQKELLALDKGESTIAEIKLAGRRLGKKSQSAFEKK